MKYLICKRCNPTGYVASCPIRRQTKHVLGTDTVEKADVITHVDGYKERRIWARYSKSTGRVLSFNPV